MQAAVLRLCDDPDYGMNAAEHIDEYVRLMGWDTGPMRIEVFVRDGTFEKAIPHYGAVGRNETAKRRRLTSSTSVGTISRQASLTEPATEDGDASD